jgi:hypothetical protein
MAAITGLRLTQAIIRVLEIHMSVVTFYSDSQDVLWWIRGHGKDFRAFVANRVGEIQMNSDPQQWQHVSTDENPADLISRGVNAEEIKDSTLWWHGPEWLLLEEGSWPRVDNDKPPNERKERKKPTVLTSRHSSSQRSQGPNASAEEWRLKRTRYSCWMHLVCIHARVTRVLCNMQKKENRIGGRALHPEEIRDAEEAIVRRAQQDTFPEEFKALKSKNQSRPKALC